MNPAISPAMKTGEIRVQITIVQQIREALTDAKDFIRCAEWAISTTCDELQRRTLLSATMTAQEKLDEAMQFIDMAPVHYPEGTYHPM